MSTYTFNLILQDGEIIAESITADTRKQAKRIAQDYYNGVKSIKLIQVN